MPVLPYLEGAERMLFDRWHAAMLEELGAALTFREIRKGVQALSSLYVERRDRAGFARALQGQGKRAAFVLYYGALHYLWVHHLVRRLRFGGRSLRRILDLGCGAGTSGAAWALGLPNRGTVFGVDRSGWALERARSTYTAFGVAHEIHRGSVDEIVLPGNDGGILLAWTVGELPEASRAYLLDRLVEAVNRGAALLMVEPVAGPLAPWWDDWTRTLEPHEVASGKERFTLELPTWIDRMDRASRLAHRTVTLRVLHT